MTTNHIIDLHTDYVLHLYEKGVEHHVTHQMSLNQIRAANYSLIFSGFSYDDLFQDTERQLDLILNQVKPDQAFNLVLSTKDLQTKNRDASKKIGMLVHLEGAKYLGNDTKKFLSLYQKGLRSIGFTHNHGNQFAAGCKDDPKLPITSLGKEIIKLANKLGVIVDAAHINERGFYDLLEISTKPVIVTHGNCRALCDNPRNYTDQQIKDLAKQGGVIGIFFAAPFVRQDKKPTIHDVVNHFIHVAEIAGIDCLALGTDFGGITSGLPKGLTAVKDLPKLFELLEKAGFTKNDLQKITSQNAAKAITQILPSDSFASNASTSEI